MIRRCYLFQIIIFPMRRTYIVFSKVFIVKDFWVMWCVILMDPCGFHSFGWAISSHFWPYQVGWYSFLCLDILAALVVHCQTNQSLKLKIFGIFERLLSSWGSIHSLEYFVKDNRLSVFTVLSAYWWHVFNVFMEVSWLNTTQCLCKKFVSMKLFCWRFHYKTIKLVGLHSLHHLRLLDDYAWLSPYCIMLHYTWQCQICIT